MRWIALVGCLAMGCGGSGTPDAGEVADGGGRADAGAVDAGRTDAGRPDAGPDRDAPRLVIDFPVTDALVERPSVVIAGRATDESPLVAVRVDGELALSDDGFATWRATVPLPPGLHTVAVEAEDAAGNVATLQRRVLLRTPIGQVRDIAYDAATRSVLALVERDGAALLQRVTLATGLAEDVADLSSLIGSGGAPPSDLALDAAGGRAFVTVSQAGSADVGVYRVDLSTAAVEAFSTDEAPGPSAPLFQFPSSVVLDAAGSRLLVADNGLEAIVAVDLATGERSVVSDAADAGPAMLDYNLSLGLDPAGGRALVAAHRIRGTPGLYAVDLATGARAALSTMGSSTPLFGAPNGVVRLDAAGPAYVLDRFRGLIEVDLATGARAALAPSLRTNALHLIALDGALAFGDLRSGRLVRVEVTGAESTLAQNAFPVDWDTPPFRLAAVVDDVVWLMGDETFARVERGALTEVLGAGALSPARTARELAIGGGAAYATFRLSSGQLGLDRIDLATGSVSTIRDASTGGPAVTDADGLAIDADGERAFVIDGAAELFAVSIRSGEAAAVGAPPLPRVGAMAWDDGRVLVAQAAGTDGARVVAIDPGDGSITMLSDATHAGPALSDPDGVGASTDGTIYLSDSDRVVAISPDGNRRVVADAARAEGLTLLEGLEALWTDGGRIYARDGSARALQLDPETGGLVVLAEHNQGFE